MAISLLVRKIDKAKWLQNDILNGGDISADAITNCMKTTKNTLSTWLIPTLDDLPDAILAIVSGHQHIDTIDVVYFHKHSLENNGIVLQQTKGNTPVKDLVDRHIDISNLTYKSLGTIASNIVQELRASRVERYTRAKIIKLLNDAIIKGRLQKNELHESVQSKL